MVGVKFNETHSADLGLNWRGAFRLSPPEVVTKYEQIPGKSGSVDYSEALTGYVTYGDRVIDMVFELETVSESEYISKLSSIMNLLHGKRVSVILDTDPDYQWDCRLTVNNERQNQRYCTITISGTAYPYKRKNADTVIEEALTGTAMEIVCSNTAEPVVPLVEAENAVQIQFGSKSFSLSAGESYLEAVFLAGDNVLTVTGTGDIKISYREGSL